ncbi:carbohydrate-binding protein [bacterium]|nr:MAG: carbohydrate-binding protein [bacterium]
MKRTARLLLLPFGLAALSLKPATVPAQPKTTIRPVDPHADETKAHRDARMKWWREARFGMFIHWGLYSVPAGIWKGQEVPGRGINTQGYGEWIMHNAQIPVADYATLAPQFNPTKFNADEWVSYAKAAGMKYIVVTAKHHDGFAIYPSKVSKYNIKDATPFTRDPLAELAVACKKQGIKFGIYYSQNLDWTYPGGGPSGRRWDPAQQGDFHAYVKNLSAPQVNELLTNYKPAVLWWDIPGDFTPDEARSLTASFGKVPGLIANDRMGGGVRGDTGTPEQYIPATGFKDRDWEVCMTMNDTWGYKVNDHNFKSSESLTRNLIDIASKGGNYLLNIGPDASGIVPSPEVERLAAMGAWMKKNGASIYGTTASPFKKLGFDGRATVKGKRLYLNVFNWPTAGLRLSNLQTPVKKATVLATGEKLQLLKATDGTLSISKPAQLDSVSTAIVLDLAAPPVVIVPEVVAKPQTNGSYLLPAIDATLEGDTIQVEGSDDDANIGYWTNAKDAPSWKIKVPEGSAKTYQVQLQYASESAATATGSRIAIQVDGVASGVTGTVASTGSWDNYRTLTLEGSLKLTPGRHVIRVVALTKPNYGVMNLRRVSLIPTP